MRSLARKKKILRAIVDSYIQTAAPVGSRRVIERYGLRISPATVRNIMAELEEMGLIRQPHTSAGRIPTDRGYRMYVDSLMEPEELTEREKGRIKKRLTTVKPQIETFIKTVSRLLSDITLQAGIIFLPEVEKMLLKHLKLVPLQGERILAVLITSSGLVKDYVFSLMEELSMPQLRRISSILNKELEAEHAPFLNKVEERLLEKLDTCEEDELFYLYTKALEVVRLVSVFVDEDEKLYLEGISYMLKCPEFSDKEKLNLVLRAFEEKNHMLRIIEKSLGRGGLTILIGEEHRFRDIQDCSAVVSTYDIPGGICGALGVIGPTRMEYSKVTSVVEYIAEEVTRTLSYMGRDI